VWSRRYGLEFQQALLVAWEASAYVCSQRLQPFLPELVPFLKLQRNLRLDDITRSLLLKASVSTSGRSPAPKRKGLVGRRMSPGIWRSTWSPTPGGWRASQPHSESPPAHHRWSLEPDFTVQGV
jgi:hypothetical protein